jgi:hypothetical protein
MTLAGTARITLGTILGGLVMFVWGAASHLLIPYGTLVFLRFSDENTVARAITANAPRSGVYFLPYMPEGDPAGMQAAQEKLTRGPFVFAAVRVGAMGEQSGYLVTQLVIDLLTGVLATVLLLQARPETAPARALFLGLVGLAAWVALALPHWNWYAFSLVFTLGSLLDLVVGFALAGLVISPFLPKRNGI